MEYRKDRTVQEKKYSLFTAICMISGIVIGSGIFFKADDILLYTNGNMILGILIFVIASFAIVFGSLTISQLAMKTDRPGGIIAYAEEFVNQHVACAFGWYQIFIYLPALIAVVSHVAAIYVCQLFSIQATLEMQAGMSIFIALFIVLLNTVSTKLGGLFQNASTIIKLVPLVFIAILGITLGNPAEVTQSDISNFRLHAGTFTWVTAFAPIAFSFDGWIVSTALSHEIKNSKRNLPLALMISPLLILVAYVAYFVGITSLLGQEAILQHGDESVYIAANQLFGPAGAKLVLVFIVISVLGTVNGLALGYIRMPYTMASRHMFPLRKQICNENGEQGTYSIMSGIICFLLILVWISIHYATQKFQLPGDVSEIAICVNYLNYIVLYVVVIMMAKRSEIQGFWKGLVNPVFAIIGSLIIFSGSISNPLFEISLIVCFGIMLYAYFYSKKKRNQNSTE